MVSAPAVVALSNDEVVVTELLEVVAHHSLGLGFVHAVAVARS